MASVLIRTAIIYFLFMIAIRLMGKRQVGELQLSELVTTFMLSELAVNPIQDNMIPLSYAVIPIIFLLSSEVILSFVITKSSRLKKLFIGNPSVLIQNGVLNQKELSKMRISLGELLGELRLKNVADIDDVDYAILEQNGKLSVFLKKDKQTVSLEDMKIKKNGSGIAHAIIIDGEIKNTNLQASKKTAEWVDEYLKKNGINKKNVFLLTVDDAEKVSVIYKNI